MNFIYPKEYTDPQNYYYFDNGLNNQEINLILEKTSSLPEKRAIVGKNEINPIRTSLVKWIPQSEEWSWLYNKLMNISIQANQLWKFNLYDVPEQIQFTEYYASEKGHYGWHQDMGKGPSSIRKVSITVQLSDPSQYEGGDFQIWKAGDNPLTTPKGKGTVIIFPSYMMHRVTTVTSGTRQSLVLWVGGDHYR